EALCDHIVSLLLASRPATDGIAVLAARTEPLPPERLHPDVPTRSNTLGTMRPTVARWHDPLGPPLDDPTQVHARRHPPYPQATGGGGRGACLNCGDRARFFAYVKGWIAPPLFLAPLLCLIAAPAASAGTAEIRGDATSAWATYAANQFPLGEHETNDVTVKMDGGSIVFHDAGAPVKVDGCEQVDEHTARCTPLPGARLGGTVATG